MSEQTLLWLILAGVVALAGLLLWLRDRYRDLRHIPEAERKLAERRNTEGARGFVCFFYAVMCVTRAVQIPTFFPRIYYVLGAFLFAWLCLRSYRNYQTIRTTMRTSKRHDPHDGGAT
jgi:hypothetical protein